MAGRRVRRPVNGHPGRRAARRPRTARRAGRRKAIVVHDAAWTVGPDVPALLHPRRHGHPRRRHRLRVRDRPAGDQARRPARYPPGTREQLTPIRDASGDQLTTGRFPVVNVNEASTLGAMLPGIQHHYEETSDGQRTAWMIHPDGSWARATATGNQAPAIHQSGPRRLWDILDDLRHDWLRNRSLPAYGAKATITADGAITLTRGHWRATIPATTS